MLREMLQWKYFGSLQRVLSSPQAIPAGYARLPEKRVRMLERSGVPRSVAMSMVGHKTESMYRRSRSSMNRCNAKQR